MINKPLIGPYFGGSVGVVGLADDRHDQCADVHPNWLPKSWTCERPGCLEKVKKNIPQMVVKDGYLPRGFNSVISYEVTILHIGNGWVGNPFDLSMCSWGILRIRNLVGPLVRNWAIKLSMIMTHELWQLWWGFMIPHASHALLEGQPQNGFLQFCQPHLKHTVDGRNPANHLECKKPCN